MRSCIWRWDHGPMIPTGWGSSKPSSELTSFENVRAGTRSSDELAAVSRPILGRQFARRLRESVADRLIERHRGPLGDGSGMFRGGETRFRLLHRVAGTQYCI